MVSIQMIIIRIIGLYLIAVTMLVKSECETEAFSSQFIRRLFNRHFVLIIFINCKHMKFQEEPLFSALLNYYKNNPISDYANVDVSLLSTARNITLFNSEVSLNSKTFQNFTELKTLNLISNNLLTFDMTPIPKLENLDLSRNLLTSLNNTNFRNFKLSSLSVSHNQLSSIYCSNVSTKIDLSHNQLNDSCKFASSIKYIDISYNNLTFISDTHFKDLKELEYIDLSHNYIKNLKYNCFEGLQSLFRLNLSYNQIEQIDRGATYNLEHLRKIDLSYNDIYDLDIMGIFYPMENLYELRLDGNFLKDLDVKTLTNLLKKLYLISISFSQISCNKLVHYINELRKHNIRILKGPIIYQHNVNGILCTPVNKTNPFENNFEFALYSVEKVHSLIVATSVLFIFILLMLIVVNYYRYKIMRRF